MADEVKIRNRVLDKYNMYATSTNLDFRQTPRLVWSEWRGNPRITVYTNNPKDTLNYGMINAPMNPETFFAFLNELEDMANGPNGVKGNLACYTRFKNPEGGYGEKTLLSNLLFGKDDEGMIWLSVISGTRPKIKFEFTISDFHEFTFSDGRPVDKASSSKRQLLGLLKPIRDVYSVITTGFKEPKGPTYTPPAETKIENTITPAVQTDEKFIDDIPF